ncbi:MAG: 4Fe-4S binding protein [Lachnospiraceae bacterium]|nr:4Fe-4S binding protein [Lachnospiraceae bacterium]
MGKMCERGSEGLGSAHERKKEETGERERLENLIESLWQDWPENAQAGDYAMRPELAGVPFFERPLLGVADAEDSLFQDMKRPGVIGPHYLLPGEWLPGARTVISLFFPFTEAVRESNRRNREHASALWQHARIDGELALVAFKRRLAARLIAEGYEALVPSDDVRYQVTEPVSSNWSERHAAFIAGLGTFGMSRGLITKRGMAGRFASVITTAVFSATKRPYTEVYEYCTRCGACARRCPAEAIHPERPMNEAKDQVECGAYLDILKQKTKRGEDTRPPEEQDGYRPAYTRDYFGCGKCQVGVPCEAGRPVKR